MWCGAVRYGLCVVCYCVRSGDGATLKGRDGGRGVGGWGMWERGIYTRIYKCLICGLCLLFSLIDEGYFRFDMNILKCQIKWFKMYIQIITIL